MKNEQLMESAARARVYDLAQPYFIGMPHFPTHPPFLYSLAKRHGDMVMPGGVSSASDAIALGAHTGTHIDALCHFSCGGKLFGGAGVADLQSYGEGVKHLSIDTVAPMLRRGILLDIAGLEGGPLPVDFTITPEHLNAALEKQGTVCRAGDIVLLRTGWAQYWDDAPRYLHGGGKNGVEGPGPGIEGAQWLTDRKIFAAGSDTIAFERMPSPEMPVHVHLLFRSGIHIIEALNLEDLARDGVYEFLWIAAPLKLRGATGSPIRPIALVA